MKIRIIQIGKNKDKYVEEVSAEFIKRISPYAQIEIATLQENSLLKNIEDGKRKKDEFIVLLDERGKQFSSPEFSKFLAGKENIGQSVCFVIGGPFGLPEEIKSHANLILSFSKMTFTHQMIRLFLLEQIYRGFCIMHDKEYHY